MHRVSRGIALGLRVRAAASLNPAAALHTSLNLNAIEVHGRHNINVSIVRQISNDSRFAAGEDAFLVADDDGGYHSQVGQGGGR